MGACKEYTYDQVCLDIYNHLKSPIQIYGKYEECHQCSFQHLVNVVPNSSTSLSLSTRYPVTLYYTNGESGIESWSKHLHEYYRYGWNITESSYSIFNEYAPSQICSIYFYILYLYLFLFGLGVTYAVVKCTFDVTLKDFCKRYELWHNKINSETIEISASLPKWKKRVKSLDVFRGICVLMMIFGDAGAAGFWFFDYSVWNGLLIADLVYPWFLWIMGFAMSISFNEKLKSGLPRRDFVYQVCRRSAVLIVLGIILNSNETPISSLRIPGILQRIGLTYFFVGLLETLFSKTIEESSRKPFEKISFLRIFADFFVSWEQWTIILICVLLHTVVTYGIPMPGCGVGYTGPGGLHMARKYWSCAGGMAGYIDRSIFGCHLNHEDTFSELYNNYLHFDSEGLLGTLMSLFTVYMGVQGGKILTIHSHAKDHFPRLIIWGCLLGLIGGSLCGFSKNGGLVPINKNLWSLSFALVSGGTAFILEAVLHFLTDHLQKWDGCPFVYAGMNSLILYIGHILLADYFPFSWSTEQKSHASLLVQNLWTTGMWLGVGLVMYKRNKFYSV